MCIDPVQEHDPLGKTYHGGMDTSAAETLCSYSGFENVQSLLNPDSGSEWAAADFLISVIENQELAGLGITSRTSISDSSETKTWPQGIFYQPSEGVTE